MHLTPPAMHLLRNGVTPLTPPHSIAGRESLGRLQGVKREGASPNRGFSDALRLGLRAALQALARLYQTGQGAVSQNWHSQLAQKNPAVSAG